MTLDKNKLEAFKQIFLQRQQEIVDSHVNRVEEIDFDGGDEIDIVQSNLLKAMAEKLSLRDKEALNKIKNGLQKIEDGTFGDCESCEEPIPEKRLIAVPYCTTCVECAEAKERRARQYRA